MFIFLFYEGIEFKVNMVNVGYKNFYLNKNQILLIIRALIFFIDAVKNSNYEERATNIKEYLSGIIASSPRVNKKLDVSKYIKINRKNTDEENQLYVSQIRIIINALKICDAEEYKEKENLAIYLENIIAYDYVKALEKCSRNKNKNKEDDPGMEAFSWLGKTKGE